MIREYFRGVSHSFGFPRHFTYIQVYIYCVLHDIDRSRSEEDWRALFDTLYEDQVAVDAAEARADAPLASGAATGQVVDAARTDGVVRRAQSPSSK